MSEESSLDPAWVLAGERPAPQLRDAHDGGRTASLRP